MANSGTTSVVTGDIELPGVASAVGWRIVFALNRVDTDGTQVVIPQQQVAIVQSDGAITISLWRTASGSANAWYDVTAVSPDSQTTVQVGQVNVPDTASANLNTLLDEFMSEGGFNPPFLTQAQAAVAAAEAAAAEAVAAADTVNGHVVRADNPHAVTAAQVGLGNVNNTSDADKPVSTAQRLQIDLAGRNANAVLDLEMDAANFQGSSISFPGAALNASITFPTVAGRKVARFTDLTSASQIVLASAGTVSPVKPMTTYRLVVEARLTGATVLSTDQITLQLAQLDENYLNAAEVSFSTHDLTAEWQWLYQDLTTDETPLIHLRGLFTKRNTYVDATGVIEVRSFYIEDRTNGLRLEQRLQTAEASTIQTERLSNNVTAILDPGFADGAAPYTATAAGDENFGNPPVSITFPTVDGRVIARWPDLSGTSFITLSIRELIKPVPGNTYRITARARLTGASALGTGQARLQVYRLDASYVPTAAGSAMNVDLTEDYQDFSYEWTCPLVSPPEYLRFGFFKMNTYSDATGVIDLAVFKVSDQTDGALVSRRLSSLENAEAASPLQAPVAAAQSAHMVPVFQGSQGRADIALEQSNWFALQPAQQNVTVRAAGSRKVDLGYMIAGTSAVVSVPSGSSVTLSAGRGATFAGRVENQLAMTGPGLIQIVKVLNALWATVLQGTGTFSTVADPVMAKSILLAGQSNANLFYTYGGIGGFVQGLRSVSWMTQGVLDEEFAWVNGATGGTSLLEINDAGNGHWYDDVALVNGPALDTCLAAIDASIAAGQPVPEDIIWSQGESDTNPMEVGTITVPRFTSATKVVWDIIRDHLIAAGAINPQVFVMATGGHDTLIRRKGVSQIRQAVGQAIADLAWAHRGAQAFDVPRPWGDIHYNEMGYHALGRRLARAWANVRHGATYDLGPVVTSAVASGSTITVSFDSVGFALNMPSGLSRESVTIGRSSDGVGGAPCGFCVIKADGSLIEIDRADIGTNSIVLTCAADVAGATLHFPAGYYPEHRLYDFVRDTQIDPYTRMPGLPLIDYAGQL